MKLYVFDGGRAHLPDMSHLTPDRNVGKPVTIPHAHVPDRPPKGLVVFDTGVDTDDAAATRSWRRRRSSASTGRCSGWDTSRATSSTWSSPICTSTTWGACRCSRTPPSSCRQAGATGGVVAGRLRARLRLRRPHADAAPQVSAAGRRRGVRRLRGRVGGLHRHQGPHRGPPVGAGRPAQVRAGSSSPATPSRWPRTSPTRCPRACAGAASWPCRPSRSCSTCRPRARLLIFGTSFRSAGQPEARAPSTTSEVGGARAGCSRTSDTRAPTTAIPVPTSMASR